jgi:PAS domain S-box-containing protein
VPMLDKIPGYIIIAEDDAGHTAAISRALGVQMPACRLEFVTCLRDFRAAAARHSPDIALLDLNLRDGCAIEVLSAPAENGAYPVLIMTSHGSEQSAVTALKSGALDYVIKTPESLADIGRAIERVLQQWQLLQERQRSAEDIKQREIRFRALAENAPDIIARLDTECRYIYINSIAKKKWGIPPSAYVGHSNAEIGMPPEIGALLDRTVRAVVSSGQENTATFRYEHKNEGPKYFHSLMVPELDEQGKVSTILSITRDITNQRIVEETLRESEAKYRTLVESASEAISVIEGERIIFCNSDRIDHEPTGF